MSLTVKETGEGSGDFSPIAEGTYLGRCIRVVDIGTQTVEVYQKKGEYEEKQRMIFMFELPSETYVNKDTGEELPMYVAKEFNHSLHENSALRPILESIRGKAFSDEELIAGVSLAKVAGVPCQIEIGHTKSGKAKVVKVFGIAKGMTCPPAKHEIFAYEIENGLNDKFNKLPEWVQKKIVLAKEWTFGKKIDDATAASDTARMESLGNPGDDVPDEILPF